MKTFIAQGTEHHDHGDRSSDVNSIAATEMLCAGPKGYGVISHSDVTTERRCVGKRCMAWRWGTPLIERSEPMDIDSGSNRVRRIGNEEFPIGLHQELSKTMPEGEGWLLSQGRAGMSAYWYRVSERRGHCFFMEKAK